MTSSAVALTLGSSAASSVISTPRGLPRSLIRSHEHAAPSRTIGAHGREQPPDDAAARRHGVGRPHLAVDDPRLAADLGDDPSRLERDERGGARDGRGAQEPAAVGQRPTAASPPPDQRPQPEAEEREPDRHHRLEREVHQDRVRPVLPAAPPSALARPRPMSPYASHDSAPGIRMPRIGLLPAGERDPADRERGVRRACPTALPAPRASSAAARPRASRPDRRRTTCTGASTSPNVEPDRERAPVIRVAPPLQHADRVDRRDREPGRHVAGQDHVRGHDRRRWVQHRLDRLHVDDLAARRELEPDRRSASTSSRSPRTMRSPLPRARPASREHQCAHGVSRSHP